METKSIDRVATRLLNHDRQNKGLNPVGLDDIDPENAASYRSKAVAAIEGFKDTDEFLRMQRELLILRDHLGLLSHWSIVTARALASRKTTSNHENQRQQNIIENVIQMLSGGVIHNPVRQTWDVILEKATKAIAELKGE